MANFILGIVSLSLGVVVLENVFITTVKNTNQTSLCYYGNGSTYSCAWSTGEVALWGLLTIGSIAGMVYGTLNVFGIA